MIKADYGIFLFLVVTLWSFYMLDKELLEILVCPESKQRLELMETGRLELVNSHISTRKLLNRAGKPISESIDAALIREDGKFAYPVRDRIPIMLIEESFPLEQL